MLGGRALGRRQVCHPYHAARYSDVVSIIRHVEELEPREDPTLDTPA